MYPCTGMRNTVHIIICARVQYVHMYISRQIEVKKLHHLTTAVHTMYLILTTFPSCHWELGDWEEYKNKCTDTQPPNQQPTGKLVEEHECME